MSQNDQSIVIVYDGECPFCKNYMSLLRLKKSGNNVILIDARTSLENYHEELKNLAIDLNEGMAVKLNGRWYHGHEAINILALQSTQSNYFNKFNSWIFKHKMLCIILYPVMRFFRNLTLKLLGRKKIDSLNQ